MYERFFGLTQAPFSIAPDPHYLFMSERHREALAHLLYGVGGGGGFVLLTGEIGAGKTTVCRCFLEQIPRRCNVAYIFNPKLTVSELLKSVCDEFSIPYPQQGPGAATVKDYLDPLNEFLLKMHAVGQNNVLIIDEAQNLSTDVLEQLRLLTNLETNERKLLQIILIGQPELRTMLARPELEQLAQRVIARFHLEALSLPETAQYIRHRLQVAGMTTAMPFDRAAVRRIHQVTRGVPRRINLLCDRALLGAYAGGLSQVTSAVVSKAATEVFDHAEFATPPHAPTPHRRTAALAAVLVASVALLGVVALTADSGADRVRAAGKAASAVASGAASAPVLAAAASAVPLTLTAEDLSARFSTPLLRENDAWRELAPAWGLAVDAGDPCQSAQQQQVYCYRSTQSTLAAIRQLARPGIVTLRDARDQPVYALLTGLSDHAATVRMGDTAQTISLASLAQLWRGDFATYWRAPPGYANRVVDAGSGPLADWLLAKLAALQGDAGRGDSLKSQVLAFQRAQGLVADGLAGPTTFMQLNRATGVDEPRLQN